MFAFKELPISHPEKLHTGNLCPCSDTDDILIRGGNTIHILCCNRLLNVFKRIPILRSRLKIESLRSGLHLLR